MNQQDLAISVVRHGVFGRICAWRPLLNRVLREKALGGVRNVVDGNVVVMMSVQI